MHWKRGKLAGAKSDRHPGDRANFTADARRGGTRLGALGRVLLSSIDGNLTIMTALTFTMLIGFAGLGIDASSWYSQKRQMQTAADAAAMAGAYELSRPDASVADVIAAGEDAAARNGFGDAVTVTLHNGGMAVRAVVSRAAQSFLSQVVLEVPPTLTATAVARRKRASICLLSLDPDAADAVYLQGTSHITSPGCRIYVNSSDPAGLRFENSTTITSLSTCVVGGFSGNPARVTPGVDTGCPPAVDPLESLEPPSIPTVCNATNRIARPGDTLQPGLYCGGITAHAGTVTFAPGEYIIKDGGLAFGNADVVGDDVFFYLTGTVGSINAAGNGEIRLTGRRTGAYQGVIFYQDRVSTPGVPHTFAGRVEKHYEGTIYLPTADVTFIGNASGATTSPYSIYIARRFSFVGAGSLTINENYDDSSVPLPQGIDDERAVVLVQ